MGTSTTLDLPPVAATRDANPRDRLTAHALATDIARRHGDALMRTARKYAGDPDDAHDAYQRALELLLEHAATIDRTKALPWMHVVVRREASALRRRHERHLPLDIDALDRREIADHTDDHLTRIDLASRASEALATLKDTEATALCLRAQGMSYDEIANQCGWSYTKVNRAVSEGRKAFVDHYLGRETGAICATTERHLEPYLTGNLRTRDHVKLRAHLTRCPACRARLHAEREADRALRALLPPALAITTNHSWLGDHLLTPLSDLATRLTPATDQALAAKLSVAAISTVALAGGGLTVTHELTKPATPPAAIRAALTTTPATATRTTASPLTTLTSATTTRTRALIDDARAKARATARKNAAKRRAAAQAAQTTAASREFTPAATEFSATPSTGTTTNTTGSPSTATRAEPPQTAPIEVPTDTAPADTGITVTDTP